MKTVAYLTTSLNGKLALSNDEIPWSDEAWEYYKKRVEIIGNFIIGHRSYDILEEADDFASLEQQPFVVGVASTPVEKIIASSQIAATLQDALKLVEERGFEKALVGGGAKLFTSALKANLIDELWLDIEPIIFEGGVDIVANTELMCHFKLTNLQNVEGKFVHVEYEAVK